MSDHLKEARDEVELARLLTEKVPYESQDREAIRNRLNLAKFHIDQRVEEMDQVEELKGRVDNEQ